MGREIRRVPPDWQHPKDAAGEYAPLHDQDYVTASEEWIAAFDAFRSRQHSNQRRITEYCNYYWEWNMPPDEESYRKRQRAEEEATAYQVYETVTEGTPITPVFATKEEIVEYLVENGTDWAGRVPSESYIDHRGWDRAAAEEFVASGFAPSLVVVRTEEGVSIYKPGDARP